MVSKRPPPAHWNTYRPSYDAAPSSARGSNAISLRERPNRSREPPHRSRSPRNQPYRSESYRSHTYRGQAPSPPVTKVHDGNNGINSKKKAGLLWPANLDDLMGRTTRALDLVVNYERDACGGNRWAADAIYAIKYESKTFHERIAKLRAWARDPERAKAEPAEFADDIRVVRYHCEYIQRVIYRTEQNSGGESLYELEKAREAETEGGEKDQAGAKDSTTRRWKW